MPEQDTSSTAGDSLSPGRRPSSKTWLITGGFGFIGSHLADLLVARGDAVRILDDLSSGKAENAPSSAQRMHGDVTVPATVRSAMDGVDGCFHLAAIASVVRSNENWIEAHRVNIGGLVNVLCAARRRATPVVSASSAAVYGANPALPLAESARTDPLSPYAVDKLSCDLQAKIAAGLFGVLSVGLRLFNVHGTRQDRASPYSGVITMFVERILQGEPVVIHGDGKQSRDFMHAADVVRAFVAAMQVADLSAGVFNVGPGRAKSLLELLAILRAVTGNPVDLPGARQEAETSGTHLALLPFFVDIPALLPASPSRRGSPTWCPRSSRQIGRRARRHPTVQQTGFAPHQVTTHVVSRARIRRSPGA